MIVLDTHIWIWWVHGSPELPTNCLERLDSSLGEEIGVSVISCWEIAKLAERNRLTLPTPLLDWFSAALSYPSVRLLPLSPEVAVESTRLPGSFHRDPADQLIVATARIYGATLMTLDEQILQYAHVKTLP